MTSDAQSPMLLDTNILSLFFKANDTRAAVYLPHLEGKLLAVCFITVGEIFRWTMVRNHQWGPARVNGLEERLRLMVHLPSNDAVARQWARIQTSTPKGENDAWIAACAITYGCTLVTDDKAFQEVQGLDIICYS